MEVSFRIASTKDETMENNPVTVRFADDDKSRSSYFRTGEVEIWLNRKSMENLPLIKIEQMALSESVQFLESVLSSLRALRNP